MRRALSVRIEARSRAFTASDGADVITDRLGVATPAAFQFHARRCDRVVKAVPTDSCVAFPRPAEAAEFRPGAMSLHPRGGQAILSVGAFPRKSL